MPQSQNQHSTVASSHGFGDLPSIDEQRFDNDCLPTPPIIASALNADTPSGQNALPVPNHYDSDSISINGGHTPFFGLPTPFLSTASSPTLSKFINSATPSSSASSIASEEKNKKEENSSKDSEHSRPFSSPDAPYESKNTSQAYNSAFSTYTTSPASMVMQQYMSSADPFLSKINAKPYEENKSTLNVVASTSGSVSPSKQHPLSNLSLPSSAFSKFNSPPIPYQNTYSTAHPSSNIMSLQNHMYIPPQNYASTNILPPASSIQQLHGNSMSFPANYGPHYDATAMSKKRKNGQISIHPSETEDKNESDRDASNPPASPGAKRARISPVSSPEDFSTSGIPAASLVLPSQRNMYIKLTSGMVNASKDKQPGGKGNKRPLDPHQVEVDVPKLTQHNHEFSDLRIEASLIGSKDSMEVELETLGKIVVSEKLKGKHHANKPCNFIFDNLIVQHSSHSNGRKLYVRFKLLAKDTEAILGFCDSAPFETITKRGIEKQKKKSKQIGSEQSEPVASANDSVPSTASAPSTSSSVPPPSIPPPTSFEFRLPPPISSNTTISPPFSSPLTPSHASTIKSISDKLGSCYKRCLLKLSGEFNFQDVKHIHVLFNDKNAQVLSANRDVIILETSPLPKGIYQIMISFDQKTYIVGPKFTVYDPAIPEDLNALQTLFFEPSPLRVEETGQETISSFK